MLQNMNILANITIEIKLILSTINDYHVNGKINLRLVLLLVTGNTVKSCRQ